MKLMRSSSSSHVGMFWARGWMALLLLLLLLLLLRQQWRLSEGQCAVRLLLLLMRPSRLLWLRSMLLSLKLMPPGCAQTCCCCETQLGDRAIEFGKPVCAVLSPAEDDHKPKVAGLRLAAKVAL